MDFVKGCENRNGCNVIQRAIVHLKATKLSSYQVISFLSFPPFFSTFFNFIYLLCFSPLVEVKFILIISPLFEHETAEKC